MCGAVQLKYYLCKTRICNFVINATNLKLFSHFGNFELIYEFFWSNFFIFVKKILILYTYSFVI